MDGPQAGPRNVTLLAFAAAVLIGGANFVAVKYSNRELDPSWGAAIRFTMATVLFFAITLAMRLKLPRGRALAGAVLYGALGFGGAYFFLYYSLVGLEAGTTSVIIASAPLVTLIFAVLHRQERFTLRGLAGGLLAVLGIGVLSRGSLGGDLSPSYLGAALLGVACIAESTVVIKGFPRVHPIPTNAVAMAAGGAILLVVSAALGDEWVVPSRGQTLLSLAWLVVAGSLLLFVLYLFLISRWSASATNYVITSMPVVAVALGSIIAGERISPELLVGGLLVLLAVYVGAIRSEAGTGDRRTPRRGDQIRLWPHTGQRRHTENL